MASVVVNSFCPGRLLSNNRSSPPPSCCFLDLKPDRPNPEPLCVELPQWRAGSPRPDLVVVGAGPAGLRLAEQVSQRGPRVCVVDPAPLSVWPNNYGAWAEELSSLGLDHCVEHTWPRTAVIVEEARRRVLERPYVRVDRGGLKSHLLEGCVATGRVSFHRGRAARVSESWVACEDGAVIAGRLVVDATGFVPPSSGGAFQIAYGIMAEVESHPLPLDQMVLMDWRSARNERVPTFLYAMPMGPHRVFLEETSLVSRPALSIEECRGRLASRLRRMGIRVTRVHEEEKCVIPMGGPLPLPCSFDDKDPVPVPFGAAAGMVHPSTGYMMARAMALAVPMAELVCDCIAGSRIMTGRPLWRRVWNEGLWTPQRLHAREFYRFGMETLLRLDRDGTRSFFDAFFELEEEQWQGFLSSTLKLGELLSLSLSLFARASVSTKLDIVTKCPLPLASMISNLAALHHPSSY